jgi:hypothetical protein
MDAYFYYYRDWSLKDLNYKKLCELLPGKSQEETKKQWHIMKTIFHRMRGDYRQNPIMLLCNATWYLTLPKWYYVLLIGQCKLQLYYSVIQLCYFVFHYAILYSILLSCMPLCYSVFHYTILLCWRHILHDTQYTIIGWQSRRLGLVLSKWRTKTVKTTKQSIFAMVC